jgi:hypothetical protein
MANVRGRGEVEIECEAHAPGTRLGVHCGQSADSAGPPEPATQRRLARSPC